MINETHNKYVNYDWEERKRRGKKNEKKYSEKWWVQRIVLAMQTEPRNDIFLHLYRSHSVSLFRFVWRVSVIFFLHFYLSSRIKCFFFSRYFDFLFWGSGFSLTRTIFLLSFLCFSFDWTTYCDSISLRHSPKKKAIMKICIIAHSTN